MRKTEPERTNVQVLRGIRDRLNRKFAGMTAEEVMAYFAARRSEKAEATRQKATVRKRATRVRAKA